VTSQVLIAVIIFVAVLAVLLLLGLWLAARAVRATSTGGRVGAGVAAAAMLAAVGAGGWFALRLTADRPSAAVLANVMPYHPIYEAELNRGDPPDAFPPVEATSADGVQPGTVVFTTSTTPRPTDDTVFYPSYVAEVDKRTGEFVKAQRMFSSASMFQPEPGGRYSYNVIDKPGRNGAGFEVTHYLTDSSLNVTEQFDLDDLEGGDADLHDFELLDNGNALLLAYRARQVDLSAFGGPTDGQVWDTVIAERTPAGETVWLWDGAEHMDLADVPEAVREEQLTNEPPAYADYAHPNSLDVFPDGDVLVSIRHYDCLYRIDKGTGGIEWTFGGPGCADNEFEISGDPFDGFTHQHDATVLDDGNLLLFDNGNLREGGDRVSRVVEYEIDEEAKTAELVWSYDDGRYTAIMGSAERLDDGNTLIGWGALVGPAISEVTPDGEEVFTLSLPAGQRVYRAYHGDPEG
jgi:hypothetical protein